jgi:hypothetical protein
LDKTQFTKSDTGTDTSSHSLAGTSLWLLATSISQVNSSLSLPSLSLESPSFSQLVDLSLDLSLDRASTGVLWALFLEPLEISKVGLSHLVSVSRSLSLSASIDKG